MSFSVAGVTPRMFLIWLGPEHLLSSLLPACLYQPQNWHIMLTCKINKSQIYLVTRETTSTLHLKVSKGRFYAPACQLNAESHLTEFRGQVLPGNKMVRGALQGEAASSRELAREQLLFPCKSPTAREQKKAVLWHQVLPSWHKGRLCHAIMIVQDAKQQRDYGNVYKSGDIEVFPYKVFPVKLVNWMGYFFPPARRPGLGFTGFLIKESRSSAPQSSLGQNCRSCMWEVRSQGLSIHQQTLWGKTFRCAHICPTCTKEPCLPNMVKDVFI